MDVPFINIGGTCPPCPIGIDAPAGNSMYFNGGVHTPSFELPVQPIPFQRVCVCVCVNAP